MWRYEILGTDVYHLVAGFIVYSMLGWLVESIYMSFCNKKITNRGFAKSPFCPIYGFGGVLGYLILCPLRDNYIPLYICGAILATTFEFLVGKLMIKLFGQLWWDYNDKPFNYKGILCLESTIAWGFYAIIIVQLLNDKVNGLIDRVNFDLGIKIIIVVMAVVTIDYIIQLLNAFHVDYKTKCRNIKDKAQTFIARWY